MSEPGNHNSDNQGFGKEEGQKLAGLTNPDTQARRRHAYGLARVMKSLRIILPLLVITLLMVIYNYTDFRGTAPQTTKTATKAGKQDEQPNALIDPRFESQDAAGRPFTITAEKAYQPDKTSETGDPSQSMGITSADEIHLTKPLADIELKDGDSWLAIEAGRGIYHRKAGKLALYDKVRIFHDSGYELNTSRLHIDTRATTARNDVEVTVTGPKGRIEAQGVRADQKKQKLIFKGPARLEMQSRAILP
jgi:hypothetical protein